MLNINRVRKVLRAYNGSSLYRYNTDTNQFEFYNANLQYKDLMTSKLYINNPYLNNDGLANPKLFSTEGLYNQNDENTLKNSSSTLNLIGTGLDFANSMLQLTNRGYYGPNSHITLMGDLIVLLGSNLISSVNPALGLGLKAANTTGNLLGFIGGNTDGMTKKDAWLNTGLGTFLTLGLNGFLGKTSDKFSINRDVLANMGGSYGGTYLFMEDAASKANKKFGLASNKERREANRNSAKSMQYLNTLTNIDKENQDLKSIALNTYDLNSLRYFNQINGIDFNDIRVAKTGGKLARIKKLNLHKIGGKIKEEWKPIITEEFIPIITESIDLYEKGGEIKKLRTLEELILYAKQLNPRFILRLSESPRGIKFIDDEGNEAEGSHYLEWGTDDNGNAVVYPRILEIDGNLQFLNPEDAYNRAIENKNYLIMTPEEADLFTKSGEDENGDLFGYKKGWTEFFKSFKLFKKGGKTEELEAPKIEETTLKNVIPEGALHKNKHHMENTENYTLKGIPVIDNDGELLAEIELNEIIFTLEVTKKLEELYAKYSDYEYSSKEKDEVAIEAGKLLVKEILFNTDDRTNLISTLKNGGKINGTE